MMREESARRAEQGSSTLVPCAELSRIILDLIDKEPYFFLVGVDFHANRLLEFTE
jgi:hypothetical protein